MNETVLTRISAPNHWAKLVIKKKKNLETRLSSIYNFLIYPPILASDANTHVLPFCLLLLVALSAKGSVIPEIGRGRF